MKQETKRKIINWVVKLLKYDPTKDFLPCYIANYRKIEIVRWKCIYQEEELQWLKAHKSEHKRAEIEIVQELQKVGAIKYEEKRLLGLYQGFPPKIEVTATLKFIMP